ncbi:hypothetical protein SAY87_008292 [Trapa incisa]|uniref:Uncharacterized protein n=1 Tax=Trapa incisa TaxID=236973 RepID=A0AAN7KGX1_9MYRT|nr:hypothetical protein SAY87_008292 [Trapa incisa]
MELEKLRSLGLVAEEAGDDDSGDTFMLIKLVPPPPPPSDSVNLFGDLTLRYESVAMAVQFRGLIYVDSIFHTRTSEIRKPQWAFRARRSKKPACLP